MNPSSVSLAARLGVAFLGEAEVQHIAGQVVVEPRRDPRNLRWIGLRPFLYSRLDPLWRGRRFLTSPAATSATTQIISPGRGLVL